MQGGPVDELLDVAVERPALDQLEVEVGRTLKDRVISGLTGDHGEERHLEAVDQTQEQIEADLRAQAERAVKAQLVLEAIARAEGFEASEEEIEAELQRQAARANLAPEDVRKALSDGRGGVIAGDILRSKALAFLVEHAVQHDPAPDDASEPKE